jgi:hypothetical protein
VGCVGADIDWASFSAVSELKLRRLTEHNQRLRDDLARPRVKVSEASQRCVSSSSLERGQESGRASRGRKGRRRSDLREGVEASTDTLDGPRQPSRPLRHAAGLQEPSSVRGRGDTSSLLVCRAADGGQVQEESAGPGLGLTSRSPPFDLVVDLQF